MQAEISVSIDREPDFFALCRARGAFRTVVAENKRGIVGCASVSRSPAYVRGRPHQVGYVSDVKVMPEFRRHGLAQRLVEAVIEGERHSPPAPYVGLTAAGNTAIEGLLRNCGKTRPVFHLGNFTSYQLFPFVRLPIEHSFEIRPAEPVESPELAGLLDDFHRRYTFGPVFANGGIAEILARSPGMDICSYWTARSGGRLVAALGLWDQRSFKRTSVRSMPAVLRWSGLLVRVMSGAQSRPRFPAEGDVLSFSYVRHAAHASGQGRALRALIAHAVNTTRQRDDQFVLFTCEHRDALRTLVRGIPRTRYRYRLCAVANVAGYEKEVAELVGEPLFDDAALA